jgi:HAD superfamily hydrolase (TIGR01490 family)
MDRTLVRKETASLYVRYQREIGEARRRDLIRVTYWVAQYTLGIIDAPEVAKRALQGYAGTSEDALAARCDDWFRLWVEPHVCDLGRRAVEAHRTRGDVLAIVTGASPYVAKPLARRLDIPHVVTSELEVDGVGRLTGRFIPPLNIGEGKVERTKAFASELGFDLRDATFYSDSCTDLPLLELVGEAVAVNPDPRLRRIAMRRGWRVETW